MKQEILHATASALLAGALLLPITAPTGADAAGLVSDLVDAFDTGRLAVCLMDRGAGLLANMAGRC
jgi:hypothetical protein